MVITRLLSAGALTLALAGCGLFDGNNRNNRRDAIPPPPTPAAEQRGDTRGADALFNEFFDVAPVQQATTPPPAQRVIAPEPPRQPERNFTFSPTGRYVVQVSTVANPDLANSIAQRFERMGYPAYVARVENPTTSLIGTFFRVRIGGFARVSEANNFGETVLRPLGYDFWVDNRSNDHVGMGGSGLGSFDFEPTITTIPPSTYTPAPAPTPTPAAETAPTTPTVVTVSTPATAPIFVPEADDTFDADASQTGSGWDDFAW
ncbi:MAG: SPOR domain-containing protein [Chitinivibrionia bacterium]|nr:SPOR domain-containing protein [Chitinivibrionia bacterium]